MFVASSHVIEKLRRVFPDFVMITSAAGLEQAADPQDEGVTVQPSGHAKCERCWHWRADVGAHAEHPGLCARCVSNLLGDGEPRQFA